MTDKPGGKAVLSQKFADDYSEDNSGDGAERSRPRRRAKPPAPATPENLRAAALGYLSRYASSAANLRRVLGRRVDRAARFHETDRHAAMATVDRLIVKMQEIGLLDDALYAQARVRSLHRSGASQRKIIAQLAQKGVGRADIDGALAALIEEQGEAVDLDLQAALRYASRRRLGPFRAADQRAERRNKDMAAMARTGFARQTIMRVIDAESVATLEGELLADSAADEAVSARAKRANEPKLG